MLVHIQAFRTLVYDIVGYLGAMCFQSEHHRCRGMVIEYLDYSLAIDL